MPGQRKAASLPLERLHRGRALACWRSSRSRAWPASGGRARPRSVRGCCRCGSASPPAPARGRSRTLTTPSSTSEWPGQAFVPDVTAKSAPWSSGWTASGVATVLSTASSPGGRRAHGVEVAGVEPGVGGGLDPDQRRPVGGGDDRLGVGRAPSAPRSPSAAGRSRDLADARVAVAARDEHVAGRAGAAARRRHGGHARGEDDARRRPAPRWRARAPSTSGWRRARSRRASNADRRAGGRARRAPGPAGTAPPARAREAGVHRARAGSVAHRATVNVSGRCAPRGGDTARRAGLAGDCAGLGPDAADAAAWAAKRQGTVTFAVRTGDRRGAAGSIGSSRPQAVLKAMLMTAYLLQAADRPLNGGDRSLLRPMIRALRQRHRHADPRHRRQRGAGPAARRAGMTHFAVNAAGGCR